jgi:hypothetical protein
MLFNPLCPPILGDPDSIGDGGHPYPSAEGLAKGASLALTPPDEIGVKRPLS